jgi:DNA-binding XRE family transcriptional regulator
MSIIIDIITYIVYIYKCYREVNYIGKKSVILMPGSQKILETMGEQIKMARLRRKLSVKLVAERAGISRATLWAVEKGSHSVSVGTYVAVLHALNGMDKDFLLIAKDDELGRKLQDFDLIIRKRAPKKRGVVDE